MNDMYPGWLLGTPALPEGRAIEHTLSDQSEPHPCSKRVTPELLASMQELEAQGFHRYEISRRLRVSNETLAKYLGRKLTWNRHSNWKPSTRWTKVVKEILDESGMTRRQLSLRVGCVHSLVDRWCKGATPQQRYQEKLMALHESVCQPNSNP